MKVSAILWGLVAALVLAPGAMAGQIFGTVVQDGAPLSASKIEVDCGTDFFGTVTDPEGRFEMYVSHEGYCTVRIEGLELPDVFVSRTPEEISFLIEDGELRRE